VAKRKFKVGQVVSQTSSKKRDSGKCNDAADEFEAAAAERDFEMNDWSARRVGF